VTQGLYRYYGGDDLHFITCSCYRRQPLAVARPFGLQLYSNRNCGCPALAFFARAGTGLPAA
jgi:hypothetical protein